MNNEPLIPSEIEPVRSALTQENADQGFDLLMGVKVIGLLLAKQDCNEERINVERLRDLGQLIFFLADQPASVLGELNVAIDDDEPDPGKERPVLTPIEATNNQAVGGAK